MDFPALYFELEPVSFLYLWEVPDAEDAKDAIGKDETLPLPLPAPMPAIVERPLTAEALTCQLRGSSV